MPEPIYSRLKRNLKRALDMRGETTIRNEYDDDESTSNATYMLSRGKDREPSHEDEPPSMRPRKRLLGLGGGFVEPKDPQLKRIQSKRIAMF